MKTVLSVVLALFVGYFVVGAFYWILGQVFWLTFELMKIFMALLIALPFYIIIRRKLLR